MPADCLFCKIIAGEIPGNKAAETDKILAFHDIAPQAPVHVLVIHKQHTPGVADTTDNAIFGDLLGGVRDTARQLGLSDYRVVLNNGTEAGQSVFHMHAHILGGRPLKWPPG